MQGSTTSLKAHSSSPLPSSGCFVAQSRTSLISAADGLRVWAWLKGALVHSTASAMNTITAAPGFGGRVDGGPRRFQRQIHAGALRLHQLKTPDRLTKLLALVQVRDPRVETGLHDAQRPRREHRPLVIETRHQHLHALAHRAD